jgi:predicted ATPase
LEKIIANRFELHDLLGCGGMGDVYRAIDTQTGETVAVKALHPEVLADDPSLLDRFVREGEALRMLNHPNIVHMVAAVEEGGQHYLAMEFVEGGSLKDLLSTQGKLPTQRAIGISLDLADALTRAHRLDIIHRDLKPANVLIAKDGTPRLADFGIAHLESDQELTRTGILLGTVDYLSPEVCQGEPPNELSDIWSFGVMLFQMLTGKLPFEGQNITAKITAILTESIPDLSQIAPDIPDALSDLVYRMLEKDSQLRIPSIRLVGAELEAMLKGRESVISSRAIIGESRFDTPTPAVIAPKKNLPAQPTPFVGRQSELTELSHLLNDPSVHLVTIIGAGGMGKTRLALEAGANQLERYSHGVYFIPLAPLDSPDAIVSAVAQALGFTFYEGNEPRQQLLDLLRDRDLLLILDNFEHLLSDVDLVTEILNQVPKAKILATSRARLNVQGEHLFHLEGMDFPDWETPADAMGYSAIRLFMQSACRVKPDFKLVAGNLKYVSRICKLVEGLPLGILLAASWVGMLSPEEIAVEIEKNADILETEQHDLPRRQQSMRAVFDYSWDLLTPKEREVFQKLSVFRGGFTRDAAQQAMGASLRDLMGLVDKSLLQRNVAGRYSIHELLRQYGAERLLTSGEDDMAHQFHLDFFISKAQEAEPHLRYGSQQIHWLNFLDEEQDNLRAVLEWSLISDIDKAQQLAGALWWFWHLRGHVFEGYTWINRILGHSEEPTPARATLLGKAGQQAFVLNRVEDAKALSEKSICMYQMLGDEDGQANPLLILGILAIYKADFSTARKLIGRSCELFKRIDDEWGLKKANDMLGGLAFAEGDYQRARDLYGESYSIASKLGDKDGVGYSLIELGRVYLALSNHAQALKCYEQALSIAREAKAKVVTIEALHEIGVTLLLMGDLEKSKPSFEECLELCEGTGIKAGAARALRYLGILARLQGEDQKALTVYQKSIAMMMESRDLPSIIFSLMGVALIKGKQGDIITAIHLFSVSNTTIPTFKNDMFPLDRNEYDQILANARSILGEDTFTTAWNEGVAMNLSQAIELAMMAY